MILAEATCGPPDWRELDASRERIVMLTAERTENYLRARNLPMELPPGRAARRLIHKDKSRKTHMHFPDPDRPGRILRCLRCRPLPRIADVTQAAVGARSRWARS